MRSGGRERINKGVPIVPTVMNKSPANELPGFFCTCFIPNISSAVSRPHALAYAARTSAARVTSP